MNNEFGIVIRDCKVVVSSRDVARVFEKPHNDCSSEHNILLRSNNLFSSIFLTHSASF